VDVRHVPGVLNIANFFFFLDHHFISQLYILHVPRTLRSNYRRRRGL
jgi:hypothetical protein